MKRSSTPLRTRLAPLLPAVMLAASGCIYAVQPAPVPQTTPAAAQLPLTVGVVDAGSGDADRRVTLKPADALAAALRRAGLFRDVRSASGGAGGFDLVVQVTGKTDRNMRTFFPFFLPFCDPMIIGCLPFYPLSERFTSEMQAQVSGGKDYSETGEATLTCTGVLGCVPASEGDPLTRASALENVAAKLAADFLKDAVFYRDLARSAASRQAAASDESQRRAEPAAPEPSASAAPAAAGAKPWWQN